MNRVSKLRFILPRTKPLPSNDWAQSLNLARGAATDYSHVSCMPEKTIVAPSIPLSPPDQTLPCFLSRAFSFSLLECAAAPDRASRRRRPTSFPSTGRQFAASRTGYGPERPISARPVYHGRRRPELTGSGNGGQPGSTQAARRLHPPWSGGCACCPSSPAMTEPAP